MSQCVLTLQTVQLCTREPQWGFASAKSSRCGLPIVYQIWDNNSVCSWHCLSQTDVDLSEPNYGWGHLRSFRARWRTPFDLMPPWWLIYLDCHNWPAAYRTNCIRLISGQCWSQSSTLSSLSNGMSPRCGYSRRRHPQIRSGSDHLLKSGSLNWVRFRSV